MYFLTICILHIKSTEPLTHCHKKKTALAQNNASQTIYTWEMEIVMFIISVWGVSRASSHHFVNNVHNVSIQCIIRVPCTCKDVCPVHFLLIEQRAAAATTRATYTICTLELAFCKSSCNNANLCLPWFRLAPKFPFSHRQPNNILSPQLLLCWPGGLAKDHIFERRTLEHALHKKSQL